VARNRIIGFCESESAKYFTSYRNDSVLRLCVSVCPRA